MGSPPPLPHAHRLLKPQHDQHWSGLISVLFSQKQRLGIGKSSTLASPVAPKGQWDNGAAF